MKPRKRKKRTEPEIYKKPQPVVKDFDTERLKAPFLLRVGALFVDYILLVSIPVGSILLARYFGNDGLKLINSQINNTGWLIMILVAVTNFVLLPLISSQTIGKMLTGLRIVKTDGTSPSFMRLLNRHLIGYPLTLLTGGLGLILSIFNSEGRALHDYLAGTVVVYGRRKIEKKLAEVKETNEKKVKNPLAVKSKSQQLSP